jgi:very-short-patch-repair endonuclease
VSLQTSLAASWWALPPLGRVSRLTGVAADLLVLALDPLPPQAPAIVWFRPPRGGSVADQVGVLLDELERAAVALFPRWLPGAGDLDGASDLGLAAVRTLAAAAASRSATFGPFLGDLAERAARGPVRPRGRGGSRFAAEVRAAGLGRVIADAYSRATLAVLVIVADDLSAGEERALAGAMEWLTHHGRLTVWLAGAPLRSVDRVRSVPVSLPVHVDTPAIGPEQVPDAGPSLGFPPLSGVPRRDSAAEQALERGLAQHDWAQGRRWNDTFEWHSLARTYRLDLFWPDDGLVVEVDGPEHRERIKFADDHQRDAQLQRLGYAVVRFTNEQVLRDVEAAVVTIRDLLTRRRTPR